MKHIVIIGAGLAGCTISNEFADRFAVSILEVGQKDSYHTPDIIYKKKRFAQVATFCQGLGGTTNLWHNGLIPIHEKDVSSPDFAEVLTDAKKYTDSAAEALFFTAGSYSAEYQRILSEVNNLVADLPGLSGNVDCLIYPKKFKKLTSPPGVNAFYSIRDLEFVSSRKRIKTVHFSTGGVRYSVDPDVLIVSAGTLGTPGVLDKIISASGNQFPDIGTGFIDHPIGFVGKVKFSNKISKVFDKLSIYDQGSYVSRNAIRIKSDCGQFTCCAFFRPAMTMHNNLEIYKYKSLLGASKGIDRLKNMLSPKLFHPDILAEIVSHLFGVKIPGRIYNIFLITEQRRGSHRVYHDNGKITVDWCITDKELAIYREVLIKLNEMLKGISEELNINTDITDDWLWSAAHHSCTTPLGDTEHDLIDKDLKLKFCDNVYVCDGSVIQEHSYANTGLTIGQLAFRLAEKINNSY